MSILSFKFVFCGSINYRTTVIALVLPLMISGCASTRGYPDRLIEPDLVLDDVKKSVAFDKIEVCNKSKEPSCRNSILSASMIGIDVNFSEFERKLFKENRETSFLTTVASLGLTTAGAMTGTSVLSGIATGVIGSKEAFDKEILLDQAANAIHTQMRALRQTVANRIRYGMKQSFDDYPLDSALIDIEEYYNAGTLLGAFVGITASAGQQIEESEVNKDRVAIGDPPLNFSSVANGSALLKETRSSQLTTNQKFKKGKLVNTHTTKAIEEWLKADADNENKLKQWLVKKSIKDENGLIVNPFYFGSGEEYEQERRDFLDNLPQ